MLPVVMFGVWEYYKRDKVDLYAGNILLATGFLSVFIGAKLKKYVSDSYTKVITGILLVLFGGRFVYEGLV
jgi:uncharacterized membrane protein YfcA